MSTHTFSVRCVKCGERSLHRMELTEPAEDGQTYGETHPLVVAKILECESLFLGRGWARNQHEWFCPRCLPASPTRPLH